MFGRQMRVRRYLSKWTFTLGALLGGLVIISILVFALYDWVTSAKVSDQQVRSNTLSAELSNFLLSTREPDGFSLLENARDFSMAERPLQFVELRKPFFAYLLNRQNAQRLTADKIVWEAPRPCVVEFVQKCLLRMSRFPRKHALRSCPLIKRAVSHTSRSSIRPM